MLDNLPIFTPEKEERTMLLKNIIFGATTVLELFPTDRRAISPKREKLYTPAASDLEALRGDWEKIGCDLWRAFDHEKSQHPQKEDG
jgi:hypothetical protein